MEIVRESPADHACICRYHRDCRFRAECKLFIFMRKSREKHGNRIVRAMAGLPFSIMVFQRVVYVYRVFALCGNGFIEDGE